MRWRRIALVAFAVIAVRIWMPGASVSAQLYPPPLVARDPGVRGDPPGAGQPFAALTLGQRLFFDAGLEEFEEAEDVPDGLGPRFNLNSCAGCHAQPAIGGTTPALNPEVAEFKVGVLQT